MKIWYQSFVNEAAAPGYWNRLGGFLRDHASPGTSLEFTGITPFDSYAHALVEWRCGREAIANAIRAGRDGYDGYLMGHFQDSGLYEARAASSIPVISLGEASMLFACQYGQKVGIITINPRFIPGHEHQVRKYGLADRVTGIHALSFEPGQILDAFDDPKKLQEVADDFTRQAEPLVAGGVDVLIPAGGIPMLLLSQISGFRVAGAPVLNGLPVALRMTELAIEMRQKFGLEVSRTRDFMQPPEEILDEFLTHPKL
jgi:allantoin racemase